ncbi:MAG: hypothetical protein N3Z28_03825 [Synechococcaceae cyanobacterium MAG-AL2]|uniref:hypothetical protein n=1 Tax=Candidatus Regnicoccus frigidus TaxID=3074015 RepID=UPI00283354F1|nr:hypothetical protein [Candidatus Regnicoccus frigidus]MCT4366783.1 hypothetical protein [Candidatus Regnicoccus frigidus MAG-AL2]
MAIDFPAVEPTRFGFLMPRHPVTSSGSENGIQDQRLWASVASGAQLDLEFGNIRTATAQLILATFNSSLSGVLPLTLPAILFAGIGPEEVTFIESLTTAAGQSWYWPVGQGAPTPKMSLTYRRRCSLAVMLEARLQNSP